jgi:hypothetical protein
MADSGRAAAAEATAASPRSEELILPGASGGPKLPLQTDPTVGAVPPELKAAWTAYMVNGFKQNEEMFQRTLDALMKPYRLTVRLYLALFTVGIGLFVVAAVIGLNEGNSVVAIAFAGLSVAGFLGFFVRQPLHALEENLEFVTWLGVAFNTYWTRLMQHRCRRGESRPSCPQECWSPRQVQQVADAQRR